jgi:hypothetical protein
MEDVQTKLEPSDQAGRAGYVYARAVTSPRFVPSILLVVLTWEFFVLCVKATRRPFWFDELLTFHISSLRPLALLWSAIRSGVDGMPPGYYALVLIGSKLPGDPHITLRLPSILGYILTLLGVYWFTRKRLPAFAGLTAVILITLSPFREFAVEARSYALLVGFLAVSAFFWQNIGEKRFMTPLFALSLALAVSCHHLAVLAISVFGAAELTWALLSHRIRWGVWAACVFASCPFFLDLPLITHLREITGKHFWSPSNLGMVFSTYDEYLGLHWKLALVLIVFFGITACDSLMRRLPKVEDGFRPPEIVLIGGFLIYPALLVVLTRLLSNSGYTSRYGWPAILGLVLGSVYLLSSVWRKPSSVYLMGALLIAFVVQCRLEFRFLRGSSAKPDEHWTKLVEVSRAEPGIPVVIANGHEYLEAAKYAPPELRDRLVRVVDADIAVRLTGTDTDDKTIRLLAGFVPLRVEDLAPFQAADKRFILYSGGPLEWLTRYLIETGYHLRLLANNGDYSVYIAER